MFNFDPANYPVGSFIYITEGSHWALDVTRYAVTKTTPGGQIVAEHKFPNGHVISVRVNKHGNLVGERWGFRSIVDKARAFEIKRESRLRRLWRDIARCAEAVESAARKEHSEAFEEAFKALALAIEARRAETAKTGSVEDESAVGEAEVPSLSPSSDKEIDR